MASDRCLRCARTMPPIDSEEYVLWEGGDDDPICPGCLTREEQEAIVEDYMEDYMEPLPISISEVRDDDDAKLIAALRQSGLAETAWRLAEITGVDPDYATSALRRMAYGDGDPVIPRRDLGLDVYEAVECGEEGQR